MSELMNDSMVAEYRLLSVSELFDKDWYLRTYPDVAQANCDPIVHYLKFGTSEGKNPGPRFNTNEFVRRYKDAMPHGQNPLVYCILNGKTGEFCNPGLLGDFDNDILLVGMKRLEKFPLYSDKEYEEMNADIRSNPSLTVANHAFTYGFSEGRSVFKKTNVALELGKLRLEKPVFEIVSTQKNIKLPKIGVFYNSKGNLFIKELVQDLVHSLCSMNVDAVLLDENADKATRPPLCIFVAPHEYFFLEGGRSWFTEEILNSAIMYNTEQPQTLWFERGIPYILMSRGVIDISYQTAKLFEKTGLKTLFFNPSIVAAPKESLTKADKTHQMVRILDESLRQNIDHRLPIFKRQIDLSFFGTYSERRDNFFVRSASYLAGYNNYIYYRKFSSPVGVTGADAILTRLPVHIAKNAKIALNIHRDDFDFFEWHRIVKHGMACGTLVVTEPCLPHPLYKPNIHYFEESGRQMPNLIDWLLKSRDGQIQAQKMQEALLSMIDENQKLHHIDQSLVGFLSEVVGDER